MVPSAKVVADASVFPALSAAAAVLKFNVVDDTMPA